MTFRARILLALGTAVLTSLSILALGVRREVSRKLTEQYQLRVTSLADIIGRDLARQDRVVADRLTALVTAIAADNRFRRGVLGAGDDATRGYLVDYATGAMRMSGLAMLQIQDEHGRIVSSGHFRNEFDLRDPTLPTLLRATPDGMGVVRARTAEGSLLVLARLDSVQLGTRRFTVIGGVGLHPTELAAGFAIEGVTVSLALADSAVLPAPAPALVASQLALPYLETSIGGAATSKSVTLVIRQSSAPLAALLRQVDRWFVVTLAVSGAAALLLGLWFASRISRPLADLTARTGSVDLDRLDVSFDTDRTDEIGRLSRFLADMTTRLRASVRSLKQVERRAAVGDLARQVNHDIRNGLVPIRNVFRHLEDAARDDPTRLREVFQDRYRTVEQAVEYLERLASTYASLSPRIEPGACDANAAVKRVVAAMPASPLVEIRADVDDTLPAVAADEVVLRRILENLVTNAVESMNGRSGTVSVTTTRSPRPAGHVRLVVSDTGPGMTQAVLEQAFSGFYSTKPGGTGLGLSIVKRLVLDLGGSLSVETAPAGGTKVIIDLPATT